MSCSISTISVHFETISTVEITGSGFVDSVDRFLDADDSQIAVGWLRAVIEVELVSAAS